MNKRQRQKRDRLLFAAIKELNEEIGRDLGIEPDEDELVNAFEYVKEQPDRINKTFKTYKKMKANMKRWF